MHEIQPRLIGTCVIQVGEVEVTPAASHLFALLLALVLAPRESWTRRSLQELLFAGTDDRMAAHRLRQLLYRLRTFGVALQESPDGLLRVANPIGDLLLAAERGVDDAPVGEALTTVLGLYAPRLPEPYLEWLEERRTQLARALAARRIADVRDARDRQDWATCARLAATLYAADALNEDVAMMLAESEAMLGRRERAIGVIDDFVREVGVALDERPALRKLRTRILSTRVPRREGTMRGRDECLAFLAESWTAVSTMTGARACVILGPPGMGKTRVGETFAGTVRLAGGQVIQHRCDEHARAFPLALFAQLVPDLRRRRGSIGADPALSTVLDHVAPSAEPAPGEITPPEVRRDELRRAIIDLFEAVTSEQPMLVVVDDAHLLDEASRAVVRAMVESANTAQLLVVLLCRPRPDGGSLMSTSSRFASYILPPLSDADSRALYLELAGDRRPGAAEVTAAVEQAEGNAFYLNALAQRPFEPASMPAHIRSLAQSGYLGLSADARTILDASLLLDTLASPARVTRVSAVDERGMLGALRELEDADLLRCEQGLFVGPHALLREVLSELAPSTGRAILQRRIAEVLAAECDDPGQARIVAWAAVSAWLAVGEPVAAARLALRVARLTAEVGEPESGAILLSQVPREGLGVEVQREVLDEAIVLADAGKCFALHARVLADRLFMAQQRSEARDTVARLTIQSIARSLIAHHEYNAKSLRRIIAEPEISEILKCEAAARLLAIADLHFDRALAEDAYNLLHRHLTEDGQQCDAFRRAAIVFHTAFGDRQEALRQAQMLLNKYPDPNIAEQSQRSRSYFAVCMTRLGFYDDGARIARADWENAHSTGHLLVAEYTGAMAVEHYVNAGRFDVARQLFDAIDRASGLRARSEAQHEAVYYSSGFAIALLDGDFDRAAEFLRTAVQTNGGLRAPRVRGAALANQVRLAQLRGDFSPSYHAWVQELERLFAVGRRFCAQDGLMEALWHEYQRKGDVHGASRLLQDYLAARRELGPPEALFQSSTSVDPAWRDYTPVASALADYVSAERLSAVSCDAVVT